jgi:hypothetical protein
LLFYLNFLTQDLICFLFPKSSCSLLGLLKVFKIFNHDHLLVI